MRRRLLVVAEILCHPDTPWYAKLLGSIVIAYALSPIDLIPDFIPVLGYIDDLILLPLGILLVVWLTPGNIRKAAARSAMAKQTRPIGRSGWIAAIVIVAIWLALGYFALTAFVGSPRSGFFHFSAGNRAKSLSAV